MQLQLKLKIRLTLVTFSGASESDQESIISMSTAGSDHMEEEEIDESLLDDNEEEPADGPRRTRRWRPATLAKTTALKKLPTMQDP